MFYPYFIITALIGVISAGVGGYLKGRGDADQSAMIESMQIALDGVKRQRDDYLRQAVAANEIVAKANERQLEALRNTVELEAEIEAYAKKLASAPNCSLDDADVDWLRSIARGTPRPKGGVTGTPGGVRPDSPAP